jgi:DNA-binding response OmpR family regulator
MNPPYRNNRLKKTGKLPNSGGKKMTKKILVVDDDKDTRDSVKAALESQGYDISTASDGNECVLALAREDFDLVVLDMFMPDKSGRQVFQEILITLKSKKIKVAFLTIVDSKEAKKELMEKGAVDYITKPISSTELIARVKKALLAED